VHREQAFRKGLKVTRKFEIGKILTVWDMEKLWKWLGLLCLGLFTGFLEKNYWISSKF